MIRLAQPLIPATVNAALRAILRSGQLTSGASVAQLERELSNRLAGRDITLVSSGTTAALLAFQLLHDRGVRRLLMPDFCFPSVAGAARRAGLAVTLTDIDPERWSLPPKAVAAFGPDPRSAILSIDQFGIPGPNAELARIAAQAQAPWVEDAACALGSHDGELPCGPRADFAILSFHPRKTLTTGEGGAVLSADPVSSAELRLLRNLGLAGSGLDRRFERLGFNARMSELHAAVGLAQLTRFDRALARRRKLGRRYLGLLSELPEVTVPAGFALPGVNFQSLVVLLPPQCDRSRVVTTLLEAGIETTLAGFAIHCQPVFADLERQGPLELSQHIQDRGLALPLHEQMTPTDVETVVVALRAALRRTGGSAR